MAAMRAIPHRLAGKREKMFLHQGCRLPTELLIAVADHVSAETHFVKAI